MERTASQISFIQPTERRRSRGFTLVEVLIGATLSGFTMVGVLSTFLLMGRTGANIRNYTEIESKARASLEQFSREVRMAYNVTAYDGTSVTLSMPDTTANRVPTSGSAYYTVTYTFDTTSNSLTRVGPPITDPTATSSTTTLISGVQLLPGSSAFLNYYRYVNPSDYAVGAGYDGNYTYFPATSAREIRQIEVSFLLQRKDVTVATASNKVLSARFILRNK